MNVDPRLVGAILQNDFCSFIRAIFPVVSPGAAFAPNWHVEAIAYQLTRALKGEIKRLIITVPPRSLKSICASVAFPAFVLGHDPTRRIICVSYAEALARKHANDCRALMRSTLYHRLFRNTLISNAKDTELEFATTRGGNRLATSIGGTLTGRGGNLIVIDDPLKPQDAYSEAARENAKQWYSNTLLSRLDDKTKDAIIVVMQRLHLDDLVGHLLEQEGWTHLNLPAIAESEFRVPLGPGRYHLRRVGELLHPEREPREVLDEFKRSMGSLDFAAQYQQEPVAEGGEAAMLVGNTSGVSIKRCVVHQSLPHITITFTPWRRNSVIQEARARAAEPGSLDPDNVSELLIGRLQRASFPSKTSTRRCACSSVCDRSASAFCRRYSAVCRSGSTRCTLPPPAATLAVPTSRASSASLRWGSE